VTVDALRKNFDGHRPPLQQATEPYPTQKKSLLNATEEPDSLFPER